MNNKMSIKNYQDYIENVWNSKEDCELSVLEEILLKLDSGEFCVVEKIGDHWETNQWLKKAILLYFKLKKNRLMANNYYDKISQKTENWKEKNFEEAGFRVVPGAIIRFSAFIAPNVVVMPSFINVGAHIEGGTMIDTHSTIGSCAYIGKGCHISDGVTIAGVLEPMQANPVIIEDDCFIGARSVISEGVIVRYGAVVASGVTITQSTPIIDLNGSVIYGEVPAYSVVIPGTRKITETLSASCAVIIKIVDEKTKAKTSINELLRQ